jgi:hypothetical protein
LVVIWGVEGTVCFILYFGVVAWVGFGGRSRENSDFVLARPNALAKRAPEFRHGHHGT